MNSCHRLAAAKTPWALTNSAKTTQFFGDGTLLAGIGALTKLEWSKEDVGHSEPETPIPQPSWLKDARLKCFCLS